MKRVLAILLLGLVYSACSNSENPTQPAENYNITSQYDTLNISLKKGESVLLNEDTVIKFEKVENDSRCPEGAECIWEGDAEVILFINNSKFSVNTSLKPRSVYYINYKIKLNDVTPYPVINEEINPDDYVIKLQVTLSDQNIILISPEDDVVDKDALEIRNIIISNDNLYADVSYSGGCKEHKIKLYAYKGIIKTNPPMMMLKFSHDNNGDTCEAYPTENKTYNLVPLKEYVKQFATDKVILRIYPPQSDNLITAITYDLK